MITHTKAITVNGLESSVVEKNKSVTLFDYKNIKIRTVIINGDIWFVAKDVCDVL